MIFSLIWLFSLQDCFHIRSHSSPCSFIFSFLLHSSPFSTATYDSTVHLRSSTLPDSNVLYCTVLYSNQLYSTLLHSTVLYSTFLYTTLLYSNQLNSILHYPKPLSIYKFFSVCYTLICSPLHHSVLLYFPSFLSYNFFSHLVLRGTAHLQHLQLHQAQSWNWVVE